MARGIVRRDFLKLAGAATVSGLAPTALAAGGGRICLILDPEDAAASSGPARRAIVELQRQLEAKGIVCQVAQTAEAALGVSMYVVAAGPTSQLARGFPPGVALESAESLRLAPGKVGPVPGVLVSAGDMRGFVYGLLELADRVRFSSETVAALQLTHAFEEKPANAVRCVEV